MIVWKKLESKFRNSQTKGENERGQNAEYKRNDFKEEYYSQLKEDYNLISNLCDRWAKNSQDPKFDAFKENIKT